MALVKGESNTVDEERDFLGHLRASMRGRRTHAAPQRNFWLEVDHPQEPLESRFVRQQRKGADGRGGLCQWRTTGGREKVSKILDLGDSKLALGQPNCRPLLLTEEKNLSEVVNMSKKNLC